MYHMPYPSPPTPSFPLALIPLANYFSHLEKSSWWGCGSHVPSVMDKVSEDQWCSCEPKVEKDGNQYPPMAAKAD